MIETMDFEEASCFEGSEDSLSNDKNEIKPTKQRQNEFEIRARRPRRVNNWVFDREYANASEAKSAMRIDTDWSFKLSNDTEEGLKKYYRCNKVKRRGEQCAAAVYLLYNRSTDKILRFRTTADHNHEHLTTRANSTLSKDVKIEIKKLFELNFKPNAILEALSKLDNVIPPKKYQLSNYLTALRKAKYGPESISVETEGGHTHKEKKFLKDFILLYRSHPCLWHIESYNYLSRKQTKEAYRQLIEKWREIDPEADRNRVCKKILELRLSFQSEHKRRLQNGVSNGTAEETPQLWCYDLLTFLIDQEPFDEHDDEEGEELDESEDDKIYLGRIKPESEIKIEPELNLHEIVQSQVEDSFGDNHLLNENVELVVQENVEPVEDLKVNSALITEKMVNDKLMSMITSTLVQRNYDDKYDYFAKHIAFSLREMNGSQSTIAQKMISDIIYRGQMNLLDLPSVQNFTC